MALVQLQARPGDSLHIWTSAQHAAVAAFMRQHGKCLLLQPTLRPEFERYSDGSVVAECHACQRGCTIGRDGQRLTEWEGLNLRQSGHA